MGGVSGGSILSSITSGMAYCFLDSCVFKNHPQVKAFFRILRTFFELVKITSGGREVIRPGDGVFWLQILGSGTPPLIKHRRLGVVHLSS